MAGPSSPDPYNLEHLPSSSPPPAPAPPQRRPPPAAPTPSSSSSASQLPSSAFPIRERSKRERDADLHARTFAANTFGGIGDYLRNKRQKLQLQNAELAHNALPSTGSRPAQIFAHVAVYINGYTAPPPAELRALVLARGGRVEQYLDRKAGGFVTHVVATNLTPAKMHEYRALKVVRPAWLVDSAAAGRLLPWATYRWAPEALAPATAGAQLGPVVRNQPTLDGRGTLVGSSSGGGTASGALSSAIRQTGVGSRPPSAAARPAKPPASAAADDDVRMMSPSLTAVAVFEEGDDDDGDLLVMDPLPPPPPPPPKPRPPPPAPAAAGTRKAVPQPLSRTGSRSSARLRAGGSGAPPEGRTEQAATAAAAAGVMGARAGADGAVEGGRDSSSGVGGGGASSSSSTVPSAPAPTAVIAPPAPAAPTPADLLAAKKGWHLRGENGQAKRLMAGDGWRERNTAVSGAFLEGYYANSRLHHLSTWKAELKLIVARAQASVDSSSSSASSTAASTSSGPSAAADVVRTLAPGSQPRAPTESKGKGKARASASDLSLASHFLPRSPSTTTALAGAGAGTGQSTKPKETVVLHCDFDAFFVAVSLGPPARAHRRGTPVVVCHSTGAGGGRGDGAGQGSTSEVASASYEARAFGVRAGMSLGQARKLCPEVQAVPYEFARYKETALTTYTILLAYADVLEAVSVDEALLDVSLRVARLAAEAPPTTATGGSEDEDEEGEGGRGGTDWAKVLAERIRDDVRAATGCEISIGIASNVLLARLATRKAKPAGSFHLRPAEVEAFLDPLDVRDLWGVGHTMREKIALAFKTTRVGELRAQRVGRLQAVLGPKTGQGLYDALRGVDGRPVESASERKSVSAEVNYGIRFQSQAEADTFLAGLAAEVARRLRAIDRAGRTLTLKVMVRAEGAPVEAPKFMGHGLCTDVNRSKEIAGPRGAPTDDADVLAKAAVALLKAMHVPPEELRGIGMMVTKLESKTPAVKPREAGQTALSFAARPPAPARNAAVTPVASRSPSPLPAALSQPEDEVAGPSRLPAAPPAAPGTPFGAIPTLSQVPQDVLDALPSSVLRETYPAYQRPKPAPPPPPLLPPVVVDSPASDDIHLPAPADGSPQKRRLPDVSHIARQLRPARQSPVKPGAGGLFLQQAPKAAAGPSSARPSPRRAAGSGSGASGSGLDDEVVELAGLLGWDLDFLRGLPRADLQSIVDDGREQRRRIAPPGAAGKPADKGKGRQTSLLAVDSPPAGRRPKTASRSPDKSPTKALASPHSPAVAAAAASPYAASPILGSRKGLGADVLATGQPLDLLRDHLTNWLERERARGPSAQGTAVLASFLAACAGAQGHGSMARAVGVLRWWAYELRARWAGAECEAAGGEDGEGEGHPSDRAVGRAWWAAFATCKARVDEVFVRRWGGPLVL